MNSAAVFGASFFGLPSWCEYLSGCSTGNPQITNINDFWLIGASILEMIIKLAAYLAVGLFILNGAKMMVSQGSPERVASARDGMLKATIGLVVTLLSGNLVGLIASAFTDEGSDSGIPIVPADASTLQRVLQYVFAIIGAVAVLIVIIAGIRYIVSAGDPQRINTSKNTIIYAVVGLVISVSAYIIVGAIFNLVDTGELPGDGTSLVEPVDRLTNETYDVYSI